MIFVENQIVKDIRKGTSRVAHGAPCLPVSHATPLKAAFVDPVNEESYPKEDDRHRHIEGEMIHTELLSTSRNSIGTYFKDCWKSTVVSLTTPSSGQNPKHK